MHKSVIFINVIFIFAFNFGIWAERNSYPGDVNILDFDVEDIFNNDLIPVQMVTEQLNNLMNTKNAGDGLTLPHLPPKICFNNTDLGAAVTAMRYHRHMMNEYMLSGYLAKQIVSSISTISTPSEVSIEKRVGIANNDSSADNLNGSNQLYNNHKLIEDEGSSQYTTWLKKMATFEDIQHQLHSRKPKRKITPNRRQSLNINVDPTYGEIDGMEYLEDGDITGYAYTNSLNENVVSHNPYRNHQKSLMEDKGISKTGYDNGYDDYAPPPPSHPHPHPVPNVAPATPSKQTKEIGLKDITDIALTTLAFLSFGMFILQVLMCITMNKDDTSNMVMLPMEGTDNGDLPGDGSTEEIRRKRRSISSHHIQHVEMVNNLAKRALYSINAVTSMSNDDGTCHYYSLCENNRFARNVRDGKKLWIPMWSLGISWLTTKFNASNKKTPVGNYNPVMSSLKAVVIGLSNGNCDHHYNENCKM